MKTLLPLMALWLSVTSALGATKPNMLVILTDDAGYADFGFQGGGINGDFAKLTPRLDSLATNGVRFSNGYVTSPICSPSRAGILTGRYQERFGIENTIQNYPNAGLARYQSTMADRLKTLGYRTYAVGKWHLGEESHYHPNQRGFDEFFGFLSGARTYGPYTGLDDARRLQINGTLLTETNGQPYLTDALGSAASSYVASHVANYPNDPFFMYLAFNGVHAPLEAHPDDLNDPLIKSITDPNRKTLAAMTIALDRAVGVVLNQITQLGLRTNTLVVFLSDNGGPENNEALEANWSDNGPLREGKTSLYEGGIRVPFVISWPGTIPTNSSGRVLADPIISLDLLPTFLAAAGTNVFQEFATDGVNLLPRLTGVTTNPMPRCLFWRSQEPFGEQSALRQGDWKLYRGTSGATELYDLATDLGENNNLAATHPKKVAELVAAHAEWERGVIKPLWGTGAPASTDLAFGASPLGYLLDKTSAGFGFLTYELRGSLSLGEDWSLTWSMESVAMPGLARNGYFMLGDGPNANDLIRVGLDLDNLRLSIAELQPGGVRTNVSILGPLAETYNFRLLFDAATRALTLRYGTNTLVPDFSPVSVTLVLSGSHGAFSHAGYALQSSARARFSPVNRYSSPLAPPASPSWTRLKMARDYTAGASDTNGHFMGGTELMSLVPHKRRLFAGVGYWNDAYFKEGSTDPYPGAQVLVKDSAGAPWAQDFAFGTNFLRIECLRSITLTTDKTGKRLDSPVTLLVAGTSPPELPDGTFTTTNVYVFIRDDATANWRRTSPGSVTADHATARFIFDHIDRETRIHHVFCAYGSAATVVRGGYDSATGLIEWVPAPELRGTTRMLSGGECNGWAYACIGSDGNPTNQIGGVFWREDGLNPKWRLVVEFPDHPRESYEDVRGFAAVPHPKGFGYDVALVALNSLSKVMRLDPIGGDPRNGHIVTEEVNIQQFLGDQWSDGVPLPDNVISAYNDMPELPDPVTGQPVHLLGLYVKRHPGGPNTEEGNNAWYLIRRLDATYDWGQAIDPANRVPNPILRSCRAARLSPFEGEEGRVLYLGGFDAATSNSWHNTAWLYRAELPDETARIRRDGTIPVVGIDTAYTWTYQIESLPSLGASQPPRYRLEGTNAFLEVRITNAPPDRDFYRWRISR